MGFLVNGLKNRSGQDARVHMKSRKALQAGSCSLSLLSGHGLGARGGCSPFGVKFNDVSGILWKLIWQGKKAFNSFLALVQWSC